MKLNETTWLLTTSISDPFTHDSRDYVTGMDPVYYTIKACLLGSIPLNLLRKVFCRTITKIYIVYTSITEKGSNCGLLSPSKSEFRVISSYIRSRFSCVFNVENLFVQNSIRDIQWNLSCFVEILPNSFDLKPAVSDRLWTLSSQFPLNIHTLTYLLSTYYRSKTRSTSLLSNFMTFKIAVAVLIKLVGFCWLLLVLLSTRRDVST